MQEKSSPYVKLTNGIKKIITTIVQMLKIYLNILQENNLFYVYKISLDGKKNNVHLQIHTLIND